MISKKKINYYLHFAENSCNEECQKIITQLVDEVQKLEKETIWLAHKIACYYQDIDKRCNDGQMTDYRTNYEYWHNEARKAVKKNDS